MVEPILTWQLELLGPVVLRSPAGASVSVANRKALGMLAFLAMQPDARASRERLAALLWSDVAPAQARLNLRKTLSLLRKDTGELGEAPLAIEADGETIWLPLGAVATDVELFEAAIAAPAEAVGDLHDRLASLYRGDFLQDLNLRGAAEFDSWLGIERQRLRERAALAFGRIMEAEGGVRSDHQVQAAHRVLALDPLQEPAHRALMRLYARQGRHAAAMKQYAALTDLLEAELGTVPEAETRELFQKISRGRHDNGAGARPAEGEVAVQEPAPPAVAAADPAENKQPARRRPRLWAVAASLVAAFCIAALLAVLPIGFGRSGAQAEADASIAVLPFARLGGGDGTAVFADGLTDELINTLARQSDLKVTGRSSSFFFQGREQDPREIGQRLGVRYLLQGAVRLERERLRVTARLVEAATGTVVWANNYDSAEGDAFAIQAAIAEAVATGLSAHLTPARERHAARPSPENYQYYLAASAHLRSQEADRVRTAARLFERLRNLEPRFAPGHAGYAEAMVYLARNNLGVTFEEARRASMQAIEQALTLDPSSSDALLAKAALYQYLFHNYGTEADLRTAEETLRRAIEIDPSARTLTAYGMQLASADRHLEAVEMFRRAVAQDPYDMKAQFELGRSLEYAGRWQDALAQYARLDEMYPHLSQAKTAAGRLLVRNGDLARAEPWLVQARGVDDSFAARLWLITLYANLGLTAEAEGVARSFEPSPMAQIIRLHLARRYEEASRIIERELARTGDPMWVTGAFNSATLLHRHEVALRHLRRAAPDMLGPRPTINRDAVDLPFVAAHLLKETGNRRQAERILRTVLETTLARPERLAPDAHVWRAGAWAELGDRERALAELRMAVRRGWRTLVDVNNFMRIEDYPMFEGLRADPRFRAIIAEVERSNAQGRRTLLARRPAA